MTQHIIGDQKILIEVAHSCLGTAWAKKKKKKKKAIRHRTEQKNGRERLESEQK